MRYKQRKYYFFLSIFLWIGIHLCLSVILFVTSSTARAFVSPQIVQLTATMSVPTSSPAASSDSYLPFYGSIIGAFAAIVAALIAGFFVVYQVRKNSKLEREKQTMQSQLEGIRAQQSYQTELSKMRYSEKLSVEREEQERERQRKAAATASARATMHSAKTPVEREQAYREAIHADTDISQLQILEMSQPLEVAKVYVRLRLHQETRLGYEIEPALLAAEAQRDPNALMKAGRHTLETRSSTSMTPEEALQKHKRCVVLGDPGAGKSTLLRYLTLRSIDKLLPSLPHFPIRIVLGEFAYTGKQDLVEFAVARWNERYGFPEDEARSSIEEHLEEGNALLLLDALDETVIGESEEITNESYRRVLAAISQVAVRYPKAPIVVTARKAGYQLRTHLNGFTELEVLDFRPEEIKQFIANWFTCYTSQRRNISADDLNDKLERNPRMQSLATNPLLLSLIVMVYEMQQDLPEKRAELYKQCIDTLLFRWDTSRDIRRHRAFKPEHKRQLLAEVAWHFHLQGRRYFRQDELLSVIAAFLPTVNISQEQSRAILSEIEEENGVLKEQAHGWYGFLHLTLQEYFVAQYVSENNKLEELLAYRGDPWWEEVLSLYAGYSSDASLLLQELLTQEKRQLIWKDIFHTSLLWAGRCLAARPRIKQPLLREEVLNRLFDLLQKTPYTFARDQVADILTEIGGSKIKSKLLEVLKDKQGNSSVRGQVAFALGQLGEHTVIPELVAVLKDKQDDSDVRRGVASALGQLGEQKATSYFLRLIIAPSSYVGLKDWNVLSGLARDQATIRAIAKFLRRPRIADKVYELLWSISQREKVRISMIDWKIMKLVSVRKWYKHR